MAGARHSLRLPWIPVTYMFKHLLLALASSSLLLAGLAHADEPSDASLVLLTENFPPYNMAKNGKNFAKDENIEGIAVDIVRETFKRAGIEQVADILHGAHAAAHGQRDEHLAGHALYGMQGGVTPDAPCLS